jgi:4-hydroxyphenylpyruvate dioxygenase-like putative hemolysin
MPTFSTVPKPAYVYDQSVDTWFPVGAQAYAFVSTFEFIATGGQTTFSGPDANSQTLAYTSGAVQVFLNGALLTPGDDFTATDGTSIVLASAASVSDVLVAIAVGTFLVADTYTQAQVNALIAAAAGGGAGFQDIFLLMGA